MARPLTLLCILISGLFVTSCGSSTSSKAPGCYFNEELKYLRWIDLSKKFDDTLHLSLDGKHATFAMDYSKEGKSNTITDVSTGRSVTGTVTKYKDVYFLNEKRDSVFQIYAFTSKKRNNIIGLNQLFTQQSSLYAMVSSGHDDGLIIEQIDGNYFLEADKKKLLKIYSSILLETDAWEIE